MLSSRNYSTKKHYKRGRKSRRSLLKNNSKKVIFFCVLILVIFFSIKNISISNDSASDTNKETAAQNEPAEPPKKRVDTSNLATEINQITSQYPYNTSVTIIDLNYGNVVHEGDTNPFIAASTTKILTAIVYLTDVEQGKVSLDDSIKGKTARENLRLAINRSDNQSWHAINDQLGKENLAEYAKKQGLTSYDPFENKINSTDMAQIAAKLYKRELLNEENTTLLLSWMQNTSEERFIPAGVPAGITAYHKAGYLPDRVHDVAIIDNGSAPFVLVIYSKTLSGDYNYMTGQRLFNQITTKAIETFQST